MPMTSYQLRLAEQASKEMDSGKLMHLIAELCQALDGEHEENRPSRMGCIADCGEYERKPAEPTPGKRMTSPAVPLATIMRPCRASWSGSTNPAFVVGVAPNAPGSSTRRTRRVGRLSMQ
jgi:hypothetical protein